LEPAGISRWWFRPFIKSTGLILSPDIIIIIIIIIIVIVIVIVIIVSIVKGKGENKNELANGFKFAGKKH